MIALDRFVDMRRRAQRYAKRLLVDDADGTLDTTASGTEDMSAITGTDSDSNTLYLSAYLTGLTDNSTVSGCTYTFISDGTVTQTTP